MSMGDHGQIRTVHDRMDIGGCGGTPLAIPGGVVKLRHLIQSDAFIVAAVEVLNASMLQLFGGFQKGMCDGARLFLM